MAGQQDTRGEDPPVRHFSGVAFEACVALVLSLWGGCTASPLPWTTGAINATVVGCQMSVNFRKTGWPLGHRLEAVAISSVGTLAEP
jgi:hypothetical protein